VQGGLSFGPKPFSAVSFRLSFQLLAVALEREGMSLTGSTRSRFPFLPRVETPSFLFVLKYLIVFLQLNGIVIQILLRSSKKGCQNGGRAWEK
jgi:hypothetical protein